MGGGTLVAAGVQSVIAHSLYRSCIAAPSVFRERGFCGDLVRLVVQSVLTLYGEWHNRYHCCTAAPRCFPKEVLR